MLARVCSAAVQGIEVPYKGAPQGVLAVITGEVTMGFFNTPTVITQIRGGKVKALGVTSLTRSPLLPDVPTLDELGVRGYEVNTWFGFVAPAGTPPEIVARLTATYYDRFKAAKQTEGKQARNDACNALRETVLAELIPDPAAGPGKTGSRCRPCAA